ncbi:hypothetical protein ACFL23_00355 [Patescibacteria group bacterium]
MIKTLKLPKFIFVVGSAASGKSTLANCIKIRFPVYNMVNDLNKFKEWLKNKQTTNKPCSIKSLASGGFRIIDPVVWDRALISIVKWINLEAFYIFEFARGIDLKYLKLLGLEKYQVYNHCFKIILDAQPNVRINEMLIIHIHCDFDSRIRRNCIRKEKGEHFVDESVMRRVYFEDNFRYIAIGNNHGYLNNKSKISIFSVDNSKELLPKKRVEYFNLQIQMALSFYVKQIEKKR